MRHDGLPGGRSRSSATGPGRPHWPGRLWLGLGVRHYIFFLQRAVPAYACDVGRIDDFYQPSAGPDGILALSAGRVHAPGASVDGWAVAAFRSALARLNPPPPPLPAAGPAAGI